MYLPVSTVSVERKKKAGDEVKLSVNLIPDSLNVVHISAMFGEQRLRKTKQIQGAAIMQLFDEGWCSSFEHQSDHQWLT